MTLPPEKIRLFLQMNMADLILNSMWDCDML